MDQPSSPLPRSLPTPFALFLVLLVALMPIGGWLVYSAMLEVDDAVDTRREAGVADILSGARAAEALIARNTLALRVAANGALLTGDGDPCARAREALDIAPALARDFTITDANDVILCGEERDEIPEDASVRAGGVRMWLAPDDEGLILKVGVANGSATSVIGREELASAVRDVNSSTVNFSLDDGNRQLDLLSLDNYANGRERISLDIAGGRLQAVAMLERYQVTWNDRKLVLLPIAMWLLAAIIAWLLVERLLTRPLRRLRRAVVDYDPDSDSFEIPEKLGPASEVRDLADAFADTVRRIEESEGQLVTALDGQRRLVREVHHRVKNNLQVVASLLNIHSRTAVGEEAQSAYAGIGRRVEALAVVHRNHFAEVEESRGIALRPLLTELATSLRASAPAGRATTIGLDLDTASTTQDTAVAAAFLVTEIVEYAMERDASLPIEIELRRTSELTADLVISSEALIRHGEEPSDDRRQFDRVVDGLARQLRSTLDRKVSSYGVELSIFPEN